MDMVAGEMANIKTIAVSANLSFDSLINFFRVGSQTLSGVSSLILSINTKAKTCRHYHGH